MDEERILAAWQAAAADLGFTLVDNFVLTHEGDVLEYLAHLPDFGGPHGTLLLAGAGTPAHTDAARAGGYRPRRLYESYETYDRMLFVDTLNDWGWTNPERDPPAWYTGLPWSLSQSGA